MQQIRIILPFQLNQLLRSFGSFLADTFMASVFSEEEERKVSTLSALMSPWTQTSLVSETRIGGRIEKSWLERFAGVVEACDGRGKLNRRKNLTNPNSIRGMLNTEGLGVLRG